MSYIPADIQKRVRAAAKNRCGYCLTQQVYNPVIMEMDHIIPKTLGGSDDESNLWLVCRNCNNAKQNRTHAIDPETKQNVRLFNPRTQGWHRHFQWSENGTVIIGKTRSGRATVAALRLNNQTVVASRRAWVSVGWHPPQD